MVFFSCDGCGEMLKKSKVDAHAARCRRCVSVSCVDCSVSFWGDDYRLHTSCITEAERYEVPRDAQTRNGNGHGAATGKKKKRNPQQEWMDVVETCAAAAPAHLRQHMATMATLDNIPRKQKQFVNFASNSLHLRGSNQRIVEEIWGHLQEERQKRIAQKEQEKQKEDEAKKQKEQQEQEQKEREEQKKEQTKASDADKPGKEKKGSATADDAIDVKRVKKIAKKTLKKAPNRSMKLKALRKILNQEMGLPKSARKRLKTILLETAKASRDRIKIDGKIMSLRE